MAIDVPTKANSRTAVLLKSETRATVLCKQSQKKQQKTQVLISGMAVFHQLWGDSNPGQQSILVLLGRKTKQSHMPRREQRFLKFTKRSLPSRQQSQVLICGTAVSTSLQRTAVPHALLGRQSILICL